MKKSGKEPRLLQSVMEAIATLKEKQGSTQKQIIEHIAHVLRKSKDGGRNVTVQIRRALDHGLHTGLIRHRSGKYVLGLDKRDYAIFKRFRKIGPATDSGKRQHRRRGRRGKRRRRSRRRHRRRRTASNEEDNEGTEESGGSTAGGTPEPQDKGRRRKRRGGRRRSRRRRHRRHSNQDKSESESDVKSSNPDLPPEKRRSDQEKVDYQQKSNNHQERNREPENNQEDECMVNCGNPECLCNIKQEEDSPRSMSRENNYYNDSYLN